MLTHWRITIRGPHPELVRPQQVHGLIAGWLEADATSDEHARPMKPFTCSIVTRTDERTGSFDVTLLRTELETIFVEAAGVTSGTVRLGRHQFTIEPPTLVQRSDWTALLDAANSPRTFRFRLHSPTTFRTGRISQPLLFPTNVFGHLRARWSAFAPEHLRPSIELDDCGLAVSHLDGHTEEFEARHTVFIGFVGELGITAHKATERDRRVLHALAMLAPYSGIGSNTTIGMGTCEFLGAD